MKEPKSLPSAIVFLMGIAVGIGSFGFVRSILVTEPTDALGIVPKTFGDIRVWAGTIDLAEDLKKSEGQGPNSVIFKTAQKITIEQNNNRTITLTKDNDGFPFLRISQDPNGKTVGLFLCKDQFTPVFWMEPSNVPNKWGQATYSNVKFTDEPIGVGYTDINFDGLFDYKVVAKGDGKAPLRFILLESSWQEVDRCNIEQMGAAIGQINYIFDPSEGLWRQEK